MAELGARIDRALMVPVRGVFFSNDQRMIILLQANQFWLARFRLVIECCFPQTWFVNLVPSRCLFFPTVDKHTHYQVCDYKRKVTPC